MKEYWRHLFIMMSLNFCNFLFACYNLSITKVALYNLPNDKLLGFPSNLMNVNIWELFNLEQQFLRKRLKMFLRHNKQLLSIPFNPLHVLI